MSPSANPELVASALERARAAHPAIGLDEAALASRFAALGPSLAKADVEGLALAVACLAGDAAALKAFERDFMPEVASVLRRTGASEDEATEVQQRVRIAILFPLSRSRSKLEYYSGKGSLRGWLRAVAAQEYATLKRARPLEKVREGLVDLYMTAATAPDVRWARREFQQAFRAALSQAVEALPERERTALKLNALDGLSIDDLARVFQVHRATAARWVARARETIEEQVRGTLARELKLSSYELDHLLRQGGAPLSFERLLATRG